MQDELVNSLMKTFTTGTRKVTGDTEIAINNERGEFSTYRELCNVAAEVSFSSFSVFIALHLFLLYYVFLC